MDSDRGATAVFVKLADRPIPRVVRMMAVARELGFEPLFLGVRRQTRIAVDRRLGRLSRGENRIGDPEISWQELCSICMVYRGAQPGAGKARVGIEAKAGTRLGFRVVLAVTDLRGISEGSLHLQYP